MLLIGGDEADEPAAGCDWPMTGATRLLLAKAGPGLRLNEHLEHENGEVVFRHACKLGLEGIVSKRKGSPYRSGRSPDWLKMKSPEAPAVKREAEEGWGKERWR
jgi:ATP-dependent DNA ligase